VSDSPVTVLIADDNDAFRGGLRELLSVQPGITVVGEATNGQDALGLAAQLDPDVVVMDLQMPALNGIEATRRLVASRPHIGVLVLTMFEDDDSVFAAMRAGAGVPPKGRPESRNGAGHHGCGCR